MHQENSSSRDTFLLNSSPGDLEMAEEKYEKAKQELEQTLAELGDL